MISLGEREQSRFHLLQAASALPAPLVAEMGEYLKGMHWQGAEVALALKLGFTKKISPSDTEFAPFELLARRNPQSLLPISELANPALTEESLAVLMESRELDPDARLVMSLNPNINPKHKFRGRLTDMPSFGVAACARFGNTFDPLIADVLRKTMQSQSTALSPNDYQTICERDTLAPEIVRFMAEIVTGPKYYLLMRNQEHQKICNVKDGQSPESYCSALGVRLHPEMATSTLERIFNLLETETTQPRVLEWQSAMAQVAAHPNSTEDMVDRMLECAKETSLVSLAIPFINTRFEEKMTVALINQSRTDFDRVGSVPSCSSATLEWAFKESANKASGPAERILTHPNFPWASSDISKVEERVPAKSLPVVRAARYLAGLPSSESPSGDRDNAWSLLFDPRLSTRRLNQLAATDSEFAALAAIHPNAENIIVPAEHEALVAHLKPKRFEVRLAGRNASCPVGEPAQQLEI